jgi:hypothetical protein
MVEKTSPESLAGLTNGRLEGISVPELLWGLCEEEKTGVLHVTADGVTKSVYIQEGSIVFGASADPDDRLSDLLLREGLITLDRLDDAVSRLGSGKRLGTLLVESGALSPRDLVRGVLAQVKRLTLGLFSLEEGEYRFEEGPLPTEEVITLGMRTSEILLEGIRQVRSFTRIRRSVGPPRTRFRLAEGWENRVEGLNLNEGERNLLRFLGDRGTSVEKLCREVFLSNFEIYQALWVCKVLGAIEEADRSVEAANEASFEGHIGPEGIIPVLVRLCREGRTGVLYASRGTFDRTFHVKEGRCIFATSTNIDDGLVAHLLRRGVISLHDREETARRLLSNKRVGTILKEMGVIDQRDLREMVREQLREIVFDTFQWSSGDYAFVEGDLPTSEEITLEESLEELVLAGVRRIASWCRIHDGCGGQGARLTLAPDYLDVLDRAIIGQEEWEVITALRTARTLREVCRSSRQGDFRVCQILWALRMLGAVVETDEPVAAEEAPAEETGLEVEAEPALLAGAEAPSDDAGEWGTPESEPGEAHPGAPATFGAEIQEDDEAQRPSESLAPVSFPESDEPAGASADGVSVVSETPVESVPPPLSLDERFGGPVAEVPEGVVTQAPEEPPLSDVEVPPIDSPMDATRYIPREEIEEALAGPATAEEEPALDLGEPVSPDEAFSGEGESEDSDDVVQTGQFSRSEVDEAIQTEPAEVEPGLEEPAEDDPVQAEPALEVEAADEEAGIEEPIQAEPAFQVEPAAEFAGTEEAAEIAQADAPSGEAPEVEETDVTEEEAPDWDPPQDLERQIARFNAMQRVLYRSIRSEVGAGAANFVRSCGGGLPTGTEELFTPVDLQSDGAWDPAGLRRSVSDLRLEDPWPAFRKLLDEELGRLQIHVGEARVESLREKIDSLGQTDSGDSSQTARPPE